MRDWFTQRYFLKWKYFLKKIVIIKTNDTLCGLFKIILQIVLCLLCVSIFEELYSLRVAIRQKLSAGITFDTVKIKRSNHCWTLQYVSMSYLLFLINTQNAWLHLQTGTLVIAILVCWSIILVHTGGFCTQYFCTVSDLAVPLTVPLAPTTGQQCTVYCTGAFLQMGSADVNTHAV